MQRKYYEKNKCIICNKNISRYSKKCHSCSQKGVLNHRFGKKSSFYKGLKYYCLDCKKEISTKTTKRCKSCSRKGILSWNKPKFNKDNANWRGGIPNCIDCNKKLSTYKIKRCKSCENKRRYLNKRNHPMFGKSATWKKIKYKNIWMRSTWEVAYAKHLDKNNIKWLYESKTFDLGETTYTPDFYLPETDEYIEIKGFWRDKSLLKFKLFKNLFTKIKINVLEKDYMKEILKNEKR